MIDEFNDSEETSSGFNRLDSDENVPTVKSSGIKLEIQMLNKSVEMLNGSFKELLLKTKDIRVHPEKNQAEDSEKDSSPTPRTRSSVGEDIAVNRMKINKIARMIAEITSDMDI